MTDNKIQCTNGTKITLTVKDVLSIKLLSLPDNEKSIKSKKFHKIVS